MDKKIILLLVEGESDKTALALICSKLISEQDIKFEVIGTDITADENMTIKYIESKIKEIIKVYLTRNPFIKKKDILKVVQIIDTDGAFIPSKDIKQSNTGKTEYYDTYILAKNKDRLIRRNISKRGIVYRLVHSDKVAGYPYEIYYFSRNIEHVLHNISGDLTKEQKTDLAYEIEDKYADCPEEFLKLLNEADFHVPGTYAETWEFIMENGNSLNRHCNISVFFENLGITVKHITEDEKNS